MARTIADVELLFDVLSGQDPHDYFSAPVPLRKYTLEELKRVPIGYFEDDGLAPVTAETRHAVRDAAESLGKQGFDVRPFRPKALEQARKLWWVFFVQCGSMFDQPLIRGREDQLSPLFREFMGIAQAEPQLTAEQLLMAWAEADVVRRKLLEQMQEFPVLLCPACSVPAFKHGEREWCIDGQQVAYLDAMRYTQWFNLLGSPAAVLPVGRSPEGPPIGVQVAGRPWEDELVLGIAGALDREFGYTPSPLIEHVG